MKQWYELFFEDYGNKYDTESFTKGTSGECDFIEKEMHYQKEIKILDIGCGTGRHAIELEKRGYDVTGIDLSDSLLDRARQKAMQEGLKIDFLKIDARELDFKDEFDLVIMMCEGAFPLMETDEMNFRILQNASNALNNNGKLIFTTLNALYPLFHSVKDFINANAVEGNARFIENNFDLMTFREHNVTVAEDDFGNKKELQCNERYYTPSEISWLLRSLNFKNVDIYGARLGEFSREHALTTEDYEMLVIADKS